MSLRNARRCAIELGEYLFQSDELEAEVRLGQLERSRQLFPGRYAFLVHGWGVRVEEKTAAYDRLLNRIAGLDRFVAQALVTVSWPSRDRYRPALKAAQVAARTLEDVLRDPRYPFIRARELVFIGHSMGCRVALELTKLLRSGHPFEPRIRLYLMAPAVPVSLLDSTGSLYDAACSAEYSCVYYSRADQAFLLPFQIVESWADAGQGLFPEPVGRHGRPDRGVWTQRVCMTPYLHGTYWKSKRVAGDVVADLRRGQIRSLPIRP